MAIINYYRYSKKIIDTWESAAKFLINNIRKMFNDYP